MKFIKITGIITLAATLLITGSLYFNKGAIVERQVAQEQAATDKSLNTNGEENFEVFSEEPQKAESTAADDTYPQSIPGIQAASRDVIALQQQIEGRMITCIQTAQRAQGTVGGLRQQEELLRAQREALNGRISSADSTPEGRALRDRLQNERNVLSGQINQVRSQINTARQEFNQYRNGCIRDINKLRNDQSKAESAVKRQFNQDIRVSFR